MTVLGAYGQPTPLAQEKETAIGELMASQIRNQAKLISDPTAQEYIDHLAGRLGGPDVHLRIDLIEGDQGITHEPVWLPGGLMLVSGSLILAAQDESEFAGMLAHAIAHEITRDWQRIREQTPAGQIPLIPAGSEIAGMVFGRSVLRPFELEADSRATGMLAPGRLRSTEDTDSEPIGSQSSTSRDSHP